MAAPIRVTVWNEFIHEQDAAHPASTIYPQGIHETIAGFLRKADGLEARTATLQQPEHGLTEEVLAATDVLIWWGHAGHDQVQDEIVARVQARVLEGMGLIVLHSAHFSKIFKALMGTTCNLLWREAGEKERFWVIDRANPIVEGVGEYFDIPHAEMYGEPFDIPAPDALVLVSWFQGGNVFRSGCCFKRGNGKIFYFSAGHETFPIYEDANVQRIITNSVRWAASPRGPQPTFGWGDPLEKLEAE